jgi:cyanophycin synthetase
MIRILERSIYRGPSVHSGTPMVRLQMDLGSLADRPSNTIPNFTEALVESLPGLAEHGCSGVRPGGLLDRLSDGILIGHVIEHVALEVQKRAGGRATRGKTRAVKKRPGVFNVMYGYDDETAGLVAGRLALELVDGLLPPELSGLEGLDRVTTEKTLRIPRLGPTTQSIMDAAAARRIPRERHDDVNLIRLGYGSRQKSFRASITSDTSHLAVETAGNKAHTKAILRAAGLPAPFGSVVASADAAWRDASDIDGRVVVKPLAGNHGRGVSLNLRGESAVREAFSAAAEHGSKVIVEEQYTGNDYRVLVIGGRVAAVAQRSPAAVVGDGVLTLAQLIANLNADPRRGVGHEKVMTRVLVDARLVGRLTSQGFTLGAVPAAGVIIEIGMTANLSAGGEAIDRTDEIHPENRALAERAAKVIGLDVAGIDIVAPDIREPLRLTGGGIVEINAAPGFRMHLEPSQGQRREVGAALVEYLYPRGSRSRIPITAVTGTNGKSTTVRMIGHILAHTGLTVGMTATTGVYIGEHLIRKVDASGPKSARSILTDPTVDAAVLETARGGILREGLAYDRADVGIVLNIAADHLGLKGVETLADLARVKSVVVRQVRRHGTSILNADDPYVSRMARHAGGRVAYFTLGDPSRLDSDLVATVDDDGGIVLIDSGRRIPITHTSTIPATLDGTARFNVQNALAAILATYAQGVSPVDIADALSTFESRFDQNPGRLNITREPGFTTIVDYAHNPAALRSLGELVTAMRPAYRRVIGVVSIPGDRRDEDIVEVGAIAAGMFDDIIFRELPDGRGRATGGVVSLLTAGAEAHSDGTANVQRIMDEPDAMAAALAMARPDDLVVLLPSDVDAVWAQVQGFAQKGPGS